MVEASSPGRVSPKIKSIDVGSNLLAERIAERERLLDAMSRKALASVGILLFALLVLPATYRLQAKMALKAAAAQKTAGAAARLLAERKAILAAEQPKIQDTQMLDTLHIYSTNYLSQLATFMNVASSGMAFASIRCEVIGGEMKIGAKADAESFAVARDFVSGLAKLDKTKTAILKSWRKNEQFAVSGVNFEVERTAEVGK